MLNVATRYVSPQGVTWVTNTAKGTYVDSPVGTGGCLMALGFAVHWHCLCSCVDSDPTHQSKSVVVLWPHALALASTVPPAVVELDSVCRIPSYGCCDCTGGQCGGVAEMQSPAAPCSGLPAACKNRVQLAATNVHCVSWARPPGETSSLPHLGLIYWKCSLLPLTPCGAPW